MLMNSIVYYVCLVLKDMTYVNKPWGILKLLQKLFLSDGEENILKMLLPLFEPGFTTTGDSVFSFAF